MITGFKGYHVSGILRKGAERFLSVIHFLLAYYYFPAVHNGADHAADHGALSSSTAVLYAAFASWTSDR